MTNEIPTCKAKNGRGCYRQQNRARGAREVLRNKQPGTTATICLPPSFPSRGGGKNPKKELWGENPLTAGNTRHFTAGPHPPRVTVRQGQSPAVLLILLSPENRGDSRGCPVLEPPGPGPEKARSPFLPQWPRVSPPPRGPPFAPPHSARALPSHPRRKEDKGRPDAPGPKKLGTALEEPDRRPGCWGGYRF